MNRALKAFGFYGRNYIIEAGKLTGFERFVRNKRFICNLFSLFKGVWVNSRSHKLRRLCGKVNLIRTAKVRCKNSVDNFIALNHQFRLSVTIATELYLLPFFCSLTHVPVPFFLVQYSSRSLIIQCPSLFGTNFFFFQQYNFLLICSE